MGNKVKTMNLMIEKNKTIEGPMAMALKYLSYQPRTIYEMQEYLKKKGIGDDIVKQIIEVLLEKKYINDETYTRLFVETRVKNKAKSIFAFRYELGKKRIHPAIVDAVLKEYNDEDLALKAVIPKIKLWETLADDQFKKKIMNLLGYRGFKYDIAISTYNYFKGLRE